MPKHPNITDFRRRIGFNTPPPTKEHKAHKNHKENRDSEMHKMLLRLRVMLVIISIGIWLTGCAATAPMKHLSSDVCLVMPESTTKTEVLSFLGEPDQKTSSPGGDETWIYFKEHKDLIRKMPLIGEQFGTLNYETVAISFIGSKVRTCTYRQLDPTEFMDFNNEHKIEIPK